MEQRLIVGGEGETKGEKPGYHDGTGSARKATRETSLDTMMEMFQRRESKADKPGFHEEISNRRETNKDWIMSNIADYGWPP